MVVDPDSPPAASAFAIVAGPLALYTGARILITIALAALLTLVMPLIVALAFGVVLQLPVSWLLLGSLRAKVTAALAAATARRRSERAGLRAALIGDLDDESKA